MPSTFHKLLYASIDAQYRGQCIARAFFFISFFFSGEKNRTLLFNSCIFFRNFLFSTKAAKKANVKYVFFCSKTLCLNQLAVIGPLSCGPRASCEDLRALLYALYSLESQFRDLTLTDCSIRIEIRK